MATELTEFQRKALDAYDALMAHHPSLFQGRSARPIVRDRAALATYATEHNIVLGIAAETPYIYLIVDLVESRTPTGGVHCHPYLRIVSRRQLEGAVNVVVLATTENASLGESGHIVMVEQERHALGSIQLELPRGAGESGLSGEANALRELREETGYVGEHASLLGTTYIDSGTSDGMARFYHVSVLRRVSPNPEIEEAISKVVLVSPNELWAKIRDGAIRDSFTLQALALYERGRIDAE